ncbi:hypothetical protein CYY_006456 [Polysphondylium violaceum]|uniref:Rhodanese domain-containing protein n=1 Tax=Polysphondylium violaceum TaxID=133409 RepID=A0A8J4PRC1_9MYCE|nr:hypothetical protein CYY_006456 [Polysphondylium violaceum]
MFRLPSIVSRSSRLLNTTVVRNSGCLVGNSNNSRSFASGIEDDLEGQTYGSGSLNLIKSKVVSTEKKPNQRKLLKPRHNVERPAIELERDHPATFKVSEEFENLVMTQQQVVDLIKSEKVDNQTVFLIDLREPKEFFADLPIKQSQNIPMEYPKVEVEVQDHKNQRGKKVKKATGPKKAFSLDSELNFWQKICKLTPLQWREKFGFIKVKPTDNIIFYSANIGRASQVAEMAVAAGFVNAKFLEGGIRNWNKNIANNNN